MDPRILELLSRLAEVSDDELAALEEVIITELETAAEGRDVENARALADAVEKVRNERSDRYQQAQAREAEIASIMGRVHAQNEGDEDDGSEEEEEEGTGTGEVTGVGDEGNGDGGDGGNGDPNKPAERINASSRPLPKIADLAKKRNVASSKSTADRNAKPGAGSLTIVTAAADVPGLTAGTVIDDRETLRKAVVERWSALSGTRGVSGRVPVARIATEFPEDRILRAGDEEGNHLKLQRVVSPQALVASGGICAPVAGLYDATTLADAMRPIRDSLPRFGAERGGIRFIRNSSVFDVTGAIGHITEQEDTDGGAGGTKPCLTITCEDVQEVLINAVSRCLQFGNFNARTHPEYVSHIIDLTLAAHSRTAESNLWESMCDASTAVTTAENLSAWRDLYASVGRAAAMFRSRHRMSPDAVLRLVAPFWLSDMLSIDLVRQMPGDGTIFGEARSRFEAGLRNIGIAVTWSMEGGTDAPTQVFGVQGAGILDGWPDTVEMLLFPEGTFLYLDGGTLDLGVVRDSTLNVTNDFQVFAEVFENVAFLGPEALCLTADLCPSGLTAGQDDTPINCAGSVSS